MKALFKASGNTTVDAYMLSITADVQMLLSITRYLGKIKGNFKPEQI